MLRYRFIGIVILWLALIVRRLVFPSVVLVPPFSFPQISVFSQDYLVIQFLLNFFYIIVWMAVTYEERIIFWSR